LRLVAVQTVADLGVQPGGRSCPLTPDQNVGMAIGQLSPKPKGFPKVFASRTGVDGYQ
jgi:hypothetical protein